MKLRNRSFRGIVWLCKQGRMAQLSRYGAVVNLRSWSLGAIVWLSLIKLANLVPDVSGFMYELRGGA